MPDLRRWLGMGQVRRSAPPGVAKRSHRVARCTPARGSRTRSSCAVKAGWPAHRSGEQWSALSLPHRASRRVFAALPVTLLVAGSPFLSPAACGGSGNAGNDSKLDADSRTGPCSTAAPRARRPTRATPRAATAIRRGWSNRATLSATITVDPATKLGAIGPAFVGLSYEKSHLQAGFFRGDNAAAVAMFDLLGPGILRVGGTRSTAPCGRRTTPALPLRTRPLPAPSRRRTSTGSQPSRRPPGGGSSTA